MKQQDRIFFRTFLIVLFVLIAIALVVYISASSMTSNDNDATGLDPRQAESIAARIAPVGRVAVGEPPAQVASGNAAERAPQTGAELYTAVCAACHAAGVLGAPKTGDKASWDAAAAKGLDAIVQTAISGINNMPPRGGSDATDAEIRAAVVHMLEQSGHPQ